VTNVKLSGKAEIAGKIIGKAAKQVYNKDNLPRNIVLTEANNK
jgi:hypothetical protein